MTDPGELFRFWIQYRYHEQGFSVPKLASALRVQPITVGHWIRGRSPIKTVYWAGIAGFFGRERPEQMIEEARGLWAVVENRRYYTIHANERALRQRAATSTGAGTAGARGTAPDASPVHPDTPGAAAAIVDSIDAATRPGRSRPPARRARVRKTHGRRVDA